ncbi:signal recognition particle-docking protein FtsY [Piscirickettsia salmonis]|uniref:signal recognition particle-docking protein FtsY n=1 Tax=Piscirickettsia salmonis TaxID=1238 RepID=UPI0012B95743|nr:Signal recognition particle receptor FtsY [Piscirickettsia salmonis]QGP31326.1 Signal recognition particle receptor FtsY [Piscirickettsia salmonis]QGP41671.1 Signal recognition particle receptor FtsY [Piscirickettsia salmonis]
MSILKKLFGRKKSQQAEEEARLKAEEEARLKAEEEARLKAEEEARLKAEEEARLKAEEEARLKAEEEARLKAEEEARLKAEEEARLKAEEEARLKAEEEARLKAEEEARLKAEEEARLKAEEEARLKAEEEARLKAEEEARLKAEEEARLKAEEEARLKAEEEARLKAEEEARLKAEEEARLKAEEEARLKAEEEARLKAEEEARLKAEEEARLKAEEEARLKAEEEARLKAEEEARLKAEEEARLKAEEEARRAEESAKKVKQGGRLFGRKKDKIEKNNANSNSEKKQGLFARLKSGLSKTRENLASGITTLLIGEKKIDDELLEDLETQLLMADVGIDATTHIITDLTKRLDRNELTDTQKAMEALKENLSGLLDPCNIPLEIPETKDPFVILVVGVNGAGKTTTIGKLAKYYQTQGKSVMLAAGDTFRAAAVEQLQVWGERNDIPVVAQHTGADSASVIFDAHNSAKAHGYDILIADTAGRLHTQSNLMEELKKVKRVLGKVDNTAPHEVLLVLDSGTGQNAINQAEQFHQAVNVSGIVMTKLDGTAKGGVIFAIAKKMKLPIRYIGVGEKIDDLRPFKSDEFIEALFG